MADDALDGLGALSSIAATISEARALPSGEGGADSAKTQETVRRIEKELDSIVPRSRRGSGSEWFRLHLGMPSPGAATDRGDLYIGNEPGDEELRAQLMREMSGKSAGASAGPSCAPDCDGGARSGARGTPPPFPSDPGLRTTATATSYAMAPPHADGPGRARRGSVDSVDMRMAVWFAADAAVSGAMGVAGAGHCMSCDRGLSHAQALTSHSAAAPGGLVTGHLAPLTAQQPTPMVNPTLVTHPVTLALAPQPTPAMPVGCARPVANSAYGSRTLTILDHSVHRIEHIAPGGTAGTKCAASFDARRAATPDHMGGSGGASSPRAGGRQAGCASGATGLRGLMMPSTPEAVEMVISNLRQFVLTVGVMGAGGKLEVSPPSSLDLLLRAELIYENGLKVEPLASSEPLLVGKTEVTPVRGKATFRLRITSLSSHRDRQRFRIRVSAASMRTQVLEPGLSVVTCPMKCVTKLASRTPSQAALDRAARASPPPAVSVLGPESGVGGIERSGSPALPVPATELASTAIGLADQAVAADEDVTPSPPPARGGGGGGGGAKRGAPAVQIAEALEAAIAGMETVAERHRQKGFARKTGHAQGLRGDTREDTATDTNASAPAREGAAAGAPKAQGASLRDGITITTTGDGRQRHASKVTQIGRCTARSAAAPAAPAAPPLPPAPPQAPPPSREDKKGQRTGAPAPSKAPGGRSGAKGGDSGGGAARAAATNAAARVQASAGGGGGVGTSEAAASAPPNPRGTVAQASPAKADASAPAEAALARRKSPAEWLAEMRAMQERIESELGHLKRTVAAYGSSGDADMDADAAGGGGNMGGHAGDTLKRQRRSSGEVSGVAAAVSGNRKARTE